MKKGLTELVFILDMSGSMSCLTDDTIGGYNTLLDEHKQDDEECLISTVLFNSEAYLVHDRVPVGKVGHISRTEYRPSGSTALVDAFAGAIEKTAMVHKYAREEDVPEKTIFIVMTDGMENSSHRYSSEQLRRKVTKEREKYGWEFIFVGANIDAFETAHRYGIERNRTANYVPDAVGSEIVFSRLCTASRAIKYCKSDSADIANEAIENIETDYKNRG